MIYSSSQQLVPLALNIEKLCKIQLPVPDIMTKTQISTKYKHSKKKWNSIFKGIINGLSHEMSSSGLICPSPRKKTRNPEKKQKKMCRACSSRITLVQTARDAFSFVNSAVKTFFRSFLEYFLASSITVISTGKPASMHTLRAHITSRHAAAAVLVDLQNIEYLLYGTSDIILVYSKIVIGIVELRPDDATCKACGHNVVVSIQGELLANMVSHVYTNKVMFGKIVPVIGMICHKSSEKYILCHIYEMTTDLLEDIKPKFTLHLNSTASYFTLISILTDFFDESMQMCSS